ncbi:MAG: branched-chain amino acid ABC transporter ATP-binding protein, partial [Deltaproteobacteria bacterium]
MGEKALEVRDIKVRYARLQVLHGVSMAVEEGETVSVLGSNGAGKSTLLKAIMASQRVHEGQILFMGQEIQGLRTEQIVRKGIV